MAKLSVCHYGCFNADLRMSMDIYADSLESAISNSPEIIQFRFRPASSLEQYSDNRIVMRYLRYWQYPHSVSKVQADIHHILDHGYAHIHPKLGKGKTCATIHDLIPLLHWKGLVAPHKKSLKIKRPWLNMKSLSYLRKFDRLIAISQSTKSDLIEHLSLDPEKIEVIPPVINSIFKPSDSEAVNKFAEKYQLTTDVRWIMISGREFYKNHSTSLLVLKELLASSDTPIMLIKTGLPSPEFNSHVDALGLNASVKTLYLETFSELPLLYSFVDCLLFPSLYEGFGMPVAESLACGTPVVASNRASLPEVGGKLAIECDVNDVAGIADAISRVLDDKTFRAQIRTEGSEWVQQFRAPVVAEKLVNFYRSL